ncbi:MAG: helix-hairpin-helix domain-containing protein [Ferruginibacter sp.]
MWKHFISSYLTFTKKERTGIFLIVFIIIFVMLLPRLYPYLLTQQSYDHTGFAKDIAALQVMLVDSTGEHSGKEGYTKYPPYPVKRSSQPLAGELFYFDPNTASQADWKRLGVRDKTIATIRKYLSKGGRFTKKEDISKIWGLYKDEVQRLTPYIQIHSAGPSEKPVEKQYEQKDYRKKFYTIADVDINSADTTALIALPGIGGKLSGRILHFRDKLGGFYNVNQIGETFGLPDSAFQKIKPYLKISITELRRININTATIDEMKTHPYIRFALANAIIQYRVQHGNYRAVADLKKLMSVTDEIYNRVAPYLMVN